MPAILIVCLAVLATKIFAYLPDPISNINKILFALLIIGVFLIAILYPISIIISSIYYEIYNLRVSLRENLIYSWQIWPKLVGALFFYFGTILIGFVCFIIPGIYLIFIEFFLFVSIIVEDISISRAYNNSRKLTQKSILDLWLTLMVILIIITLSAIIIGLFNFSQAIYYIIGVNFLILPLWLIVVINLYTDLQYCANNRLPHWSLGSTFVKFLGSVIVFFVCASIFTYTPLANNLGIKKIPPSNTSKVKTPPKSTPSPETNQKTPQETTKTNSQASKNSATSEANPETQQIDESDLDYAPEYPKSY